MAGIVTQVARLCRPTLIAVGAAVLLGPVLVQPAAARGPDGIADVAESVIDAVVNISTSQTLDTKNGPTLQLPPGSPFEELFEEFNRNRRGDQNHERTPRRVNSLGSGFIIDPEGIVVTNNHVISEADEINVILNDGTKLKAELIGKDQKTDLALLRVKPEKPLKAVHFGDSDKLRLGDWVIAIGNPFSFGGSVTAGIVSGRNRELNSGNPYDNYIQTDAAINRGNSGGPLFNLDGEVIGINTAIISPSGGSIGIGFAVPAKTALPVIDQLRQYHETRRGWLGVRIQQVNDEIAESLDLKQARGALVGGVDEKGPAKAGGIERGDVIVKFDGHEIKEVRELQLVVADTPVGKEVEVVVIRKGKEEVRRITVGRLDEGEKQAALTKGPTTPEEKPVIKRVLGLDLANLSDDLRKRYKIKDSVKGVVITGVDAGSAAAERRLSAGDVIVEVSQEAVADATDLQKRIDQAKKDGRRTVLFLVASGDGDTRWVTVPLQ
ncbi:MAG TPA: Do family serine endopeptidase [Xanthobacteraceae bacterium]|nr:Do family serine endopeptidase [Xanthobacteraceae bacterium]